MIEQMHSQKIVYTLIVSNNGEFAEAIRYNHKPVEFTNDINRAFWAHRDSITDTIELRKIVNKLMLAGTRFDFYYIEDRDDFPI